MIAAMCALTLPLAISTSSVTTGTAAAIVDSAHCRADYRFDSTFADSPPRHYAARRPAWTVRARLARSRENLGNARNRAAKSGNRQKSAHNLAKSEGPPPLAVVAMLGSESEGCDKPTLAANLRL
jgi:hypothetical protein